MSPPIRRSSRVFTISFPEDLARQVEATAKEESRSISELFRECFRRYQLQGIHRHIDAARERAAATNPIGREEDIDSYVHEIRRERNRKSA